MIGEHLTPEQKAIILNADYRVEQGFLVTNDQLARCPLALVAGIKYTPRPIELARILGIPYDAVRAFTFLADNGKIQNREQLAAAIGAKA